MAEGIVKTEVRDAGEQDAGEFERLKRDLEGYRELMLPFNKIIEWDQNYYPAVLVGVVTVIFSIIWYLEPSVLTTICLLGLLLCAADFAVPTLSDKFLRSTEWTVVQDRQFDAICTRILNAKRHCANIKKTVLVLKRDKPKVYLLLMMGAFAVLAWFGSLIDNLLLTYLIVVGLVLVPGLRKRGILQHVGQLISDKMTALRNKAQEKAKPKTN